MKIILRYLVLIIFLSFIANICSASSPRPIIPFTNQLYLQDNCPNGGIVELTFRMVSHKMGRTPISDGSYPKEVIQGKFHFSDNVSYTGETLFDFDLTVDTVSERKVTVEIPKNDTSWVMFQLEESHGSFRVFKYFVTTKDTLEIYDNDPLYHLNYLQGGPGAYKYHPEFFPERNSIDNEKKIKDTVIKHEPTVIFMQLTESELQHMRKRNAEEYVLTEKSYESIIVDGVLWERKKGEQYFREAEAITDTYAFIQRRNDSLAALPDDHIYYLCVHLTDAQKPIVKKILGSLPEPIENDFYHIDVKKIDIPKLYNAGIWYGYRNNIDCNHYPSTSDSASKKN